MLTSQDNQLQNQLSECLDEEMQLAWQMAQQVNKGDCYQTSRLQRHLALWIEQLLDSQSLQ